MNEKHYNWIIEFDDGSVGTFSTPDPMTRSQVEKFLDRERGAIGWKPAVQLLPSVKQDPPAAAIKARLEYLRKELRAERISYEELHELQMLAKHIDPGDVELLEAAGVPEKP